MPGQHRAGRVARLVPGRAGIPLRAAPAGHLLVVAEPGRRCGIHLLRWPLRRLLLLLARIRLARIGLSRQRVTVVHGLLARVGLAAGAAPRPAAGLLARHARRNRARPWLARHARIARRRLRVALRHAGAMRARARAMLLGRDRRLPGAYRCRVPRLPGVRLLPARIRHARGSHGAAGLRLPGLLRDLPARLVLRLGGGLRRLGLR
jgi:hypothetical protein